jgi:hypothetical protein
MIVAASALVFINPVFAKTDGGSASEISTDTQKSSMDPGFDEPWGDGPELTPAPQQPVQPKPGSMHVSPPPVGLIEQVGHPPINPSSPELMPSASPGTPDGGFHSPTGGFHP